MDVMLRTRETLQSFPPLLCSIVAPSTVQTGPAVHRTDKFTVDATPLSSSAFSQLDRTGRQVGTSRPVFLPRSLPALFIRRHPEQIEDLGRYVSLAPSPAAMGGCQGFL